MAVVRPDDRLRLWPLRFEQVLERLEHVRVAQIPALRAAIIHDAVIALCGCDQPRILRCVEKAVTVALSIVEPLFEQRAALFDYCLLAFGIAVGQHRTIISCRVPLPRGKAAIAFARDLRCLGINPVEIL